MIFNHCDKCGAIKEQATIQLNKLKKNIDDRIDAWKFADVHNVREAMPTALELWEWREKLVQILKDL